MSASEIGARIEALAPDRSAEPASVIALADACFALEGGMSRVFDMPRPAHPDCAALRQRCLELMRSWLPRLDRKTLRELEWRVKDRGTPLDLAARKAELARSTLPDRAGELAAFAELPAIADHEAVGALYVEKRLAIGEFPGDGVEVAARPGVWLAYLKEAVDDERSPAELLCVHAEARGRIDALRAARRRLPEPLPIDGARMAVADATAARDEELAEALVENDVDRYRGRAAQVFLDGDGHAVVHVAREGAQVVLVIVELR
jgi:hypothetical protein